jgi:aspartate racemase
MYPMTIEQKTIGIIGGASWESTALYYKLINELTREHLGNLNSAKIILYSVNYDPIVKLEQEGKWTEVGNQLGSIAKLLEKAGADFVILCCNTLHKVTSFIEDAIEIPFLHIADAAGKELTNNKIHRVGLLGTQFTMEDGFYASRLIDKFGLEVVTPSLSDRQCIDNIIYKELCQGKTFSQSKNKLINITNTLQKNKVEAILLACTELGMLIKTEDTNVPILDTTILHAKEAFQMSI